MFRILLVIQCVDPALSITMPELAAAVCSALMSGQIRPMRPYNQKLVAHPTRHAVVMSAVQKAKCSLPKGFQNAMKDSRWKYRWYGMLQVHQDLDPCLSARIWCASRMATGAARTACRSAAMRAASSLASSRVSNAIMPQHNIVWGASSDVGQFGSSWSHQQRRPAINKSRGFLKKTPITASVAVLILGASSAGQFSGRTLKCPSLYLSRCCSGMFAMPLSSNNTVGHQLMPHESPTCYLQSS